MNVPLRFSIKLSPKEYDYYIIIIMKLVLLIIFYFLHKLFIFKKVPRTLFSNQYPRYVLNISSKTNIYNQKQFENCYQKWLQLNPSLRIEFWNDNRVERFMSNQPIKIYKAFKKLKPPAYKCDLFRMCLLYKYGGIYVDCETTPFASFDYMNRKTKKCDFVSVLDHGGGIHQGFLFIKRKRHLYLKNIINAIVENVEKEFYGNTPLDPTGPICVKRSLSQFIVNKEFMIGNNGNGIYLFNFLYGPSQYIKDKEGNILMSKKHCFLSFCINKMKPSGYTKMWKFKNIYSN